MRLKDRVAIVTGGAQGIGRAYSLRLAEEGAKVVIADILDAGPVQQEIKEKGGEALALRVDVSDEESTADMVRKTIEKFGRIDILVNNAAIFATIETKPFYEISVREWDDVIRVNVKGIFLCCKAVYPQMKKQGKGKIINVASGVFFKGLPLFLHYVTSKGGVIGMTRAMAREVGDDGICVNAIAPGYTVTEVMADESIHDEAFVNAVVGSRCFKRHERPEDLTGTVIFLASDDSDFITGQTIVVDGGATMH
ncbi:MAG: 3-oxoacyl-ACP reductase FabG [Deltaproteobacteria bacterium]|nr:3-oxoacyl-ACP reductase FabG [Deltaproteobacteria bacterium]MBW2137460.1 3-oxoacyl-ACP reductase FabG [Deltaproteobacteria bacterium]